MPYKPTPLQAFPGNWHIRPRHLNFLHPSLLVIFFIALLHLYTPTNHLWDPDARFSLISPFVFTCFTCIVMLIVYLIIALCSTDVSSALKPLSQFTTYASVFAFTFFVFFAITAFQPAMRLILSVFQAATRYVMS